jgi:hypothetical protein
MIAGFDTTALKFTGCTQQKLLLQGAGVKIAIPQVFFFA